MRDDDETTYRLAILSIVLGIIGFILGAIGVPIIVFDDTDHCCGHTHCMVTNPPATIKADQFNLTRGDIGTRVRTYWKRGATHGGLVAEVIG
jgi:hypothetical protein